MAQSSNIEIHLEFYYRHAPSGVLILNSVSLKQDTILILYYFTNMKSLFFPQNYILYIFFMKIYETCSSMEPFKVFKADIHLTAVLQKPVTFPHTMCNLVFFSFL